MFQISSYGSGFWKKVTQLIFEVLVGGIKNGFQNEVFLFQL
jgi:hypothetical protein